MTRLPFDPANCHPVSSIRQVGVAPRRLVYHVLNRAVARLPLFRKAADSAAFEQVLAEAHERCPIRILAWCIMPNRWHLVLRPRKDGELTAFTRRLTHTRDPGAPGLAHPPSYLWQGDLYQRRFPLTRGIGIGAKRGTVASPLICRVPFDLLGFRPAGRTKVARDFQSLENELLLSSWPSLVFLRPAGGGKPGRGMWTGAGIQGLRSPWQPSNALRAQESADARKA